MAMSKFARMIINSEKGDLDAIKELKGYIYEKSGVANKRLRNLERTGFTEYAYARAYTFLNAEYMSIKFPQATRHREIEDLVAQAQELHVFLTSPTSTVRGARKSRERQIQGLLNLRELGYEIPTDKERLRRINKILGNSGLKISGTFRYQIMELIDQLYEDGFYENEIQTILNRYASGDIVYSDIFLEAEKLKAWKRGYAKK